MNKLFILISVLLSSAVSTVMADLVDEVNPMIGTDNHGHVFIGANVPFGAVNVGPNELGQGWDWCSGYNYSDTRIKGFSMLHLSGPGCADLGDVCLMPVVGKVTLQRGNENDENSSSSERSKTKILDLKAFPISLLISAKITSFFLKQHRMFKIY